MVNNLYLCSIDDVLDGDCCGKIAIVNGQRTSLIIVRQSNIFFVYHNICPHIGAPLDFEPDRFLNIEKDLIQCAMHGALFAIDTGVCVHGPCLGKHLTPVTIKIINEDVYIDE